MWLLGRIDYLSACVSCVCERERAVKLPAFGNQSRHCMINNKCECRVLLPPGRETRMDGGDLPGSSCRRLTHSTLKKAGHHAWYRKAAKVSCFCSEPWQNHNDSRGSGAARFAPAFHRRHDYSRGRKEGALH
jgi:hypothetical protein